MVAFAPFAEPKIVICSSDIYHTSIDVVVFGKLLALSNHRADVIYRMGAIEISITRNDLLLDILLYLLHFVYGLKKNRPQQWGRLFISFFKFSELLFDATNLEAAGAIICLCGVDAVDIEVETY